LDLICKKCKYFKKNGNNDFGICKNKKIKKFFPEYDHVEFQGFETCYFFKEEKKK
jgi:hypothetical protein